MREVGGWGGDGVWGMFACGAEMGGKARRGGGGAVQAAGRAGTVNGTVKAPFNRCLRREEARKTGGSRVANVEL
jgi:hypothetical protein